MNTHTGIQVAASLVAAIFCVLGAIFAWRRRVSPGSRYFTFALLASCIWAVAQAGEAATPAMAGKILWAKAEYLGITPLSVFWFLFALRYQENTGKTQRIIVPLFFILPALTLLGVLTNEQHHLIWSEIVPRYPIAGSSLIYRHGPGFWVMAFYSYILLISGTILLVRGAIRQHWLYKQQAVAVVAGALFPILGNVGYLAGWTPISGMDPTPVFFAISGIWTLLAISYRRLFDLVPVARDTLIESMNDSLIVLDARNRVVDINPAARALLGLPARSVIGEPIETILPTATPFLEVHSRDAAAETEFHLPNRSDRAYNLRAVLLRGQQDDQTGRMITLRDITDYKTVEQELRRLNQRLHDQLQEIHQLKDRLQEQANRDPLTGLYNRRFLIQMLENLLLTNRESVSLIMVDIDHFKQVNDHYGHAAGDLVLNRLAGLLGSQVTGSEFACRYGGEEFLIVLPGVPLLHAAERAEKWRQLYQEKAVRVGATTVESSLSMGVAASPEHGTQLEPLLHAVDTALYAAKKRGRNRVVVQPNRLLRRENVGAPHA